ncbi:MAG: Hsp70 family protein, partial [Polyangiaceae bacterium]
DDAGQTLIPSVVSFHPNVNVLVGRTAKERRIVDATSTIYSIKRLIGRSWESEEVRRARARFPFEMREGPGQASLVVARGETYTLPEISAFVLRKAKAVAEAALGTSVDRAVITVPANFNDLQRAATKVAGRVAGLEVMRILNEPTAAALAYGYGRASSERVAVYDFGGGTFDVTLLDLSNNVFEVLATAGNTFLGGDDVDLAIAERMAELLVTQHRIDARADLQVFERLRASAEILKHRLSTETEVHITVPEVGHALGGKAIDFAFSMTRAELERLVMPIAERTFDVCREAMGIARLSTNDFDQILLVGGSTRIPLVRRRVEEFFKKPLKANINPDEVVAIGAAIQAAALSGAERRKGTIPPAPSPASRQTRPNFSDAPSPADAGDRRLSPQSTAAAAVRPRFQSSPAIPSTQPFFGRPHTSTTPGIAPGSRPPGPNNESTLGALGKSSSNTAPSTLGGLGPRQRVKTGPGLGPDAQRFKTGPGLGPDVQRAISGPTLVSAVDEARSAREALNDELGLPLVGAPAPAAPVKPALDAQQIAQRFGKLPGATPAPPPPAREESVAFALGDADFVEIASAPSQPAPRNLGAYNPPSSPGTFDDEDALPLPEVPDEEITRVGAPPEPSAPQASPTRPAPTTPVNPFGGLTQPLPVTRATMPQPAAPVPPPAPIPAPFTPQRTAPLAAAGTLAGNAFGVLQLPHPNHAPPQPSYAPPPNGGGFDPVPVSRSEPPAPLLIDVTPLTLAVETVNGFCDAVIERNTQVPCERTRVFVTARDNQTLVRVRIAQGESSQFGQNTLLGEVELSSLSPAPRGEVQIAVSFSLDTNGMLNVSAKEVATGRATATQVRLITLPEAGDIARMTQRNAARQM